MDFQKNYNHCIEQGHIWNQMNPEIQRCSCCESFRYFKNEMSYLDNFQISAKREMENILNDPFSKKLYNYIRNDLSGILNGLGDKFATFEYNDFLVSNKFLKGILEIFSYITSMSNDLIRGN